MEIRNTLLTLNLSEKIGQMFQPNCRFVISISMITLLQSCATPIKKNNELDMIQPSLPSGLVVEEEKTEVRTQNQIVEIGLSPGLVRSFFQVGVLSEFKKSKIRIEKIVAFEFGALVGALYGSSTPADMEWKLIRIKKELFLEHRSLVNQLLKKPSDGKKLEKVLNEIFGDLKLQELQPPMTVYLFDVSHKQVFPINSGYVRDVVRASLTYEDTMLPIKIDGFEVRAAYASNQVEYYPNHKMIWIDSISDMKSNAQKDFPKYLESVQSFHAMIQKLDRENISIVSLKNSDIDFLDFSKKSELISSGILQAKEFLQSQGNLLK